MHRSSETVGAIAAALAKAQAELANPEKTLTATIQGHSGERSFRYASLASGLDLTRKCLGQHEIAVMQTTAVEQEQILLTTLLVHASGEWVASLWPVCPATEPSAQVKGAALTYARRYGLFTLVGIAGEDDLDAPDLAQPIPEPSGAGMPPKRGLPAARPAPLGCDQSAQLRDQLLQEIAALATEETLALWAYRSLPRKNALMAEDATAVEAAYLAQLTTSPQAASASGAGSAADHPPQPQDPAPAANGQTAPFAKPVRKRSKAHLAFVASQPCLICQASPCDAHHLKIARPRSLGRKVSDEFTVPLCRTHHRELHRHGNEANWWANMQVAPVSIARQLWDTGPAHGGANDASPVLQSGFGITASFGEASSSSYSD